MPKTISFFYLNHRGERSERTVDVDSIEFHTNPGFGYQPGWFISGFDHERAARRSFALCRIEIEHFGYPSKTVRLVTL